MIEVPKHMTGISMTLPKSKISYLLVKKIRLMTGPLSEDARVVFAFIRDHPGVEAKHIGLQFHIDWTRIYVAAKELQDRGLINVKSEGARENHAVRFYPML